ncbi:hypothetical protein [Aquabacterium sp.]|uniref:hypothetical protein n=1 Tax=Aquabacterium sp. TaxID=1872578 RepID=UPI0040384AFD
MSDTWHVFSSDWGCPPSDQADTKAQLGFYQRQTIDALLRVQQAAAKQAKVRTSTYTCQQFTGDIKATSWLIDDTSLEFSNRLDGLDYDYRVPDRTCFKGSLIELRGVAQASVIAIGKQKISRDAVAFKMNQFKNLYSDLTHLWIFLNALTVAHFFRHVCPIADKGPRRIQPELKHFKVQFDQEAIRMSRRHSEHIDLEYTVHKMPMGSYCPYTLVLRAGDLVLMNISLGINQRVLASVEAAGNDLGEAQTSDVDILIE